MTQPSASAFLESPFGTLQLCSNGTALTKILFPSQVAAPDRQQAGTPDGVLQRACREFQDWFDGNVCGFTTPHHPETGTPFQLLVWNELCQIPIGTTISYTELAIRAGRPAAVRAVGAANGRNPLPIIVPCHRVIGADGSLTGYAGGLPMKRQLLDHEQHVCQTRRSG